VTHHCTDDELTLYYYGEGRRRHNVERHLESCQACAATYREIAGTLTMIAAPETPERGDQYGLEIWQRIRHKLPERESGFSRFSGFWRFSGFERFSGFSWFGVAAAAALLMVAAFIGGRVWQQRSATPVITTATNAPNPANPEHPEHP
jgi:anti-sigma factor RsiW